MSNESGARVAAAVDPPPGADAASEASSTFFRRLGERARVEDVAALVVEDCLTDFRARRAFYAAVDPHDGTLAVRFTIGFDAASTVRLPLSADGSTIVRAALRGSAVAVDAAGVATTGLRPEAFGGLAPAYLAIVPLVALPLVGGFRSEIQPKCRLYRIDHAPRTPCWLDKAAHEEVQSLEPWDQRVRSLCPDCPVFGTMGVIVAEREQAFDPAELDRLALLGVVAGQRCRALSVLERQEKIAEKLRKEREWLDTVMVSAADPIVVTDRAGALVLQNRRAEELLVATQDDSIGKRRAISINDITFSAYLSSLGIDPKRAPRELPLVHPIEGSDLLFEAITTPAFSASGARIGAVTVLRDITDLQRATQELYQQFYKLQTAEFAIRQERDRLNLIVRSAVEPIVVTNQTNDIVLTNAEGEKLFQAAAADSFQRQRAITANDANFSSFLTDFMADADLQRKRDLRLLDPLTDEVRTFEVTAGKIRDERSQPVAVVSVFHDVTKLQELERRRLEQKLFESEKLAATGRLAASIAHEMNNPLESIKNSLYLLKSRISESDETYRFIDVASRECERVANIIRQFLGFYRPQVMMVPVLLGSLLEDELKLVENQLRKRGVKVVREFEPTPPVIGGEDQLKQVFLNLILNAIEAMPKGGTLSLALHFERPPTPLGANTPAVRATIGDSGTGIRNEHLSSIFEPFFTTKAEKGTGLGLWVSFGIVKAHRGDIKVETKVDVGTKFHVYLPVRSETEVGRDAVFP